MVCSLLNTAVYDNRVYILVLSNYIRFCCGVYLYIRDIFRM